MQALFKNLKEDFKKYNIISKYIIKTGTVILVFLIVFAVTLKAYILNINADCSLQLLFEDLLECIRESYGAIYSCAFILEFFHLCIK